MSTTQGDMTLIPGLTRNQRWICQMEQAWGRFSRGDGRCPYCGHGLHDHIVDIAQLHIYRRATWDELGRPPKSIRWVDTPYGTQELAVRMAVGKRVEATTVWCSSCADQKQTRQVTCFQAAVGVGEFVSPPWQNDDPWT